MDLQVERENMLGHIKDSGIVFSCEANCSGCCHVPVAVMPEEVVHIASLGKEINIDQLRSQVEDWNNSDKNCVFLKDGNCSIHDDKPLSCVSHLVDSPPENCHIDSNEKVNMVHVGPVEKRISELRKHHGSVRLHEALYKHLMN